MSILKPKFIINDGELYFANVEFHSDILKGVEGKSNDKTIGGGWWLWDEENKKIYLYGVSMDFGSVSKEQIIEAWGKSLINPFWEGHEIIYSPIVKKQDLFNFPGKLIKLPL